MRLTLVATLAAIALVSLVPAPVAAGPVCANNSPNAPSDCDVELKGYGGWGVCSHAVADACGYVDPAQRPCVYAVVGDLACAGPLPNAVCANNAPNAPSTCRVELKGYGSWGLCAHAQADACVYIDPAGDLCVYGTRDLVCAALL